MIRLSRLADYAVLLAGRMSQEPGRTFSAACLVEATHLPAPTVSKVLARLARSGIVESRRGARGGYRLARPAGGIPVGQIIAAVDGPVALTVCVDGDDSCSLMDLCPSAANWQRLNDAIRSTLDGISLADMTLPPVPPDVARAETLRETLR